MARLSKISHPSDPRWAVVRRHFPDLARPRHDAIRALRLAGRIDQAERIAAAAILLPDAGPAVWSEYVLLSVHSSNWEATAERAARMRDRYPSAVDGYRFAVIALQQLGRFEEAERIGAAGLQAAPMSAEMHHVHATTATWRGDPLGAAQRWGAMRQAFPGSAEAYCGGIAAWRDAGRPAEAERLGEEALQRLPGSPELCHEHAMSAFQRGDFSEAGRRWATMRDRFPERAEAYAGGVAAMRADIERQMATAEDLAAAALKRFPHDLAVQREHAMAAMQAGNWGTAVARWRQMRERHPQARDAYLYGCQALRNAGRAEAAEAVIEEGLQQFAQDVDMWVEFALVPDQDEAGAEAARRWEMVRQRFPGRREGYVHGINALSASGQFDAAESLAAAYAMRFSGDDSLQLFMGFESLGNNCEFGLVQRHFGAEPLGLLRWASIDAANLVRALDGRLETVGTANALSVRLVENFYIIEDRVTGFSMHSFVSAKDVAHDAFIKSTCKRLRFLADKLIGNLEAGDKIFVHKPWDGRISAEELTALHAAIRRYGSARLLCIKLSDERHPDGSVEHLGDGVMVGYLARLWQDAHVHDMLFQSWLQVCRTAAQTAH